MRSSSTCSADGELNEAWARSCALPLAPPYILLSINAHIYGGVAWVGGCEGRIVRPPRAEDCKGQQNEYSKLKTISSLPSTNFKILSEVQENTSKKEKLVLCP